MTYRFVPMERDYAEEIAYHWHYDGVYAFYDMQADQEDFEAFLDVDNWEDGFSLCSEAVVNSWAFSTTPLRMKP